MATAVLDIASPRVLGSALSVDCAAVTVAVGSAGSGGAVGSVECGPGTADPHVPGSASPINGAPVTVALDSVGSASPVDCPPGTANPRAFGPAGPVNRAAAPMNPRGFRPPVSPAPLTVNPPLSVP
ncbi:hypothetical protein [Streptomyces sp. SAS_270]|uniref:hypothetical protein n=1 Tax=Streptomyces sp. SAS_270 TaxID=3412748 RepID=UPI00403D3F21